MTTSLLSVLVLAAALGCDATLASGLSEDEANQIVVALHGQGIGASKELSDGNGEDALFVVRVPPEEVAPSLELMRAESLPRHDEPGLHEVFGEGGLVPTATEERARYVAAIGGELASSLESIDGILDARVHVAIPDTRRVALDEQRPRPRASVLVRYRGSSDELDEDAVRVLVAGAVQRMQREDVAVITVRAPPAPERREANLVALGPVTVTRGTATALKLLLAAAFGLNVVLAIALVVVWRRRRVTNEIPMESAG